jgi:hypothetical protein
MTLLSTPVLNKLIRVRVDTGGPALETPAAISTKFKAPSNIAQEI